MIVKKLTDFILDAYRTHRLFPTQIYCQTCGKRITSLGGCVHDSKAYCGDTAMTRAGCVIEAVFFLRYGEHLQNNNGSDDMFNYYSPQKLQEEIDQERLRFHDPLEKKVCEE